MNLKNQSELVKRSSEGSIFHPLKYQYHLRMDGELLESFYTSKLMNPVQSRNFCEKYASDMWISPEGLQLTRVKRNTGRRLVIIPHLGRVS